MIRDFEDYELVAGSNELWILKAKGVDPILNIDLKYSASIILDSCQEYSNKIYSNPQKADDACDNVYGNTLLIYINDKNITDIRLIKREYYHE